MTKIKSKLLSLLCGTIIISAMSFQNAYAHTHTDDCYVIGQGHVHDGNEIDGGKCYEPIYHIHDDSCYSVICNNDNVYMLPEIIERVDCPNSNCDYWIYKNGEDYSDDFVNGVKATKREYKCSVCGATCYKIICPLCNQTFDITSIEHKKVLNCVKGDNYIEGYKLICTQGTNNEKTLICDKTISYVTPEQPIQYETLNPNLIIHYQDEHIETVKGTSNFDKNKKYNGEEVLLTYNNYNVGVNFYSDKNKSQEIVDENNMLNASTNGTSSILIDNTTNQINSENRDISLEDSSIDLLDAQNKSQNDKKIDNKNDFETKTTTLAPEIENNNNDVSKLSKKGVSPFIIMLVAIILICGIIGVVTFIKKRK